MDPPHRLYVTITLASYDTDSRATVKAEGGDKKAVLGGAGAAHDPFNVLADGSENLKRAKAFLAA